MSDNTKLIVVSKSLLGPEMKCSIGETMTRCEDQRWRRQGDGHAKGQQKGQIVYTDTTSVTIRLLS